MKEQRVSFKTAKLAKEKGFPQDLFNSPWYNELGSYCGRTDLNKNGKSYSEVYGTTEFSFTPKCKKEEFWLESYLAPTQSLLQKWLREKHDIYVDPLFNICSKLFGWEIWDDKNEENYEYKPNSDDWDFKTYEEALEIGLLEALSLVDSKI